MTVDYTYLLTTTIDQVGNVIRGDFYHSPKEGGGRFEIENYLPTHLFVKLYYLTLYFQ